MHHAESCRCAHQSLKACWLAAGDAKKAQPQPDARMAAPEQKKGDDAKKGDMKGGDDAKKGGDMKKTQPQTQAQPQADAKKASPQVQQQPCKSSQLSSQNWIPESWRLHPRCSRTAMPLALAALHT